MEKGSGKYICFCPSGYTGAFCEKVCQKVERKIDMVFVIDGSLSLWTNPVTCAKPVSQSFEQEKNFVDEVVEPLKLGKDQSRVSVIQFATEAREEISFDQSAQLGKAKFMAKVKEIQWSGGLEFRKCDAPHVGRLTATPLAMKKAKEIFEKFGRMKDASVLKFVFIITDGEITVPRSGGGDEALALAQALNKMGVTTYSIGVGTASNKAAMKADLLKIAAGREDHRFMVAKFSDLKDKVLGMIQNTLNCNV